MKKYLLSLVISVLQSKVMFLKQVQLRTNGIKQLFAFRLFLQTKNTRYIH